MISVYVSSVFELVFIGCINEMIILVNSMFWHFRRSISQKKWRFICHCLSRDGTKIRTIYVL